jgi:hypothetical protein
MPSISLLVLALIVSFIAPCNASSASEASSSKDTYTTLYYTITITLSHYHTITLSHCTTLSHYTLYHTILLFTPSTLYHYTLYHDITHYHYTTLLIHIKDLLVVYAKTPLPSSRVCLALSRTIQSSNVIEYKTFD